MKQLIIAAILVARMATAAPIATDLSELQYLNQRVAQARKSGTARLSPEEISQLVENIGQAESDRAQHIEKAENNKLAQQSLILLAIAYPSAN